MDNPVVFTHYIAINAAVGYAIKDNRVVSFSPDNASITVLETNGSDLKLVKIGEEADTGVNYFFEVLRRWLTNPTA